MAAPEGTVYISEHVEFDDRGPVATGLFDCELRGEEDEWLGVYAEPPLGLPEALAWGRSRAERVIVRIDNDFFSAGVADGSHPRLDESRQFTRRRPAGWGSLDLTEADPPISWDVLLQLDTRSAGLLATDGAPLAAGERWRDALNQLRTVAVVEIATIRGLGPIKTGGRGWTAYADVPAAVLRLEACGWEAACQAAIAAAVKAAEIAEWLPTPEFTVAHASATGSTAARRLAHVGA